MLEENMLNMCSKQLKNNLNVYVYVSTNTLETIFSILFINKNSIIVIVYFYWK